MRFMLCLRKSATEAMFINFYLFIALAVVPAAGYRGNRKQEEVEENKQKLIYNRAG